MLNKMAHFLRRKIIEGEVIQIMILKILMKNKMASFRLGVFRKVTGQIVRWFRMDIVIPVSVRNEKASYAGFFFQKLSVTGISLVLALMMGRKCAEVAMSNESDVCVVGFAKKKTCAKIIYFTLLDVLS